jgi:hypothetical protein
MYIFGMESSSLLISTFSRLLFCYQALKIADGAILLTALVLS